jgi:hypothetical protein
MRGRFPDADVLLRRVALPQDAALPTTVAELLSTTNTFKEESSDCHIATACVPSAEICIVASSASLFAGERVVIGPQEATPPTMVAELVFTCFFLFAAVSRHSAVALVPSLDMAILSPTDCVPGADKSVGALSVGCPIAIGETQNARMNEMSAVRRCMADLLVACSVKTLKVRSYQNATTPKDADMIAGHRRNR